MLRRSINTSSFTGNANNPATAASSMNRKRGSIIKIRRTSQISTKIPIPGTRQSSLGGFLPSSSLEGRNSLKIIISPERIESICEYVKFFCPRDSHHLIEVKNLENLFLQPRFSKDSFNVIPELYHQEKIFHTMEQFLQLLQMTQMNYNEWFDFVLSRSEKKNNDTHFTETLSLQEFVYELRRLSNDLCQRGFLTEELEELFGSIVRKEEKQQQEKEDEEENDTTAASSRMDRTQLDTAIKKYFTQEQQFRFIDTTATELQTMSIYMKKQNISFKSILQVTEPALKNDQIHISQLASLISSLLIMYEVYVSEFGIPVEDTSPTGDHLLVIDPLSNPISELTGPSNPQTHRSISGNLSNTNMNDGPSILKRGGSNKSGEISKKVSFKVPMPTEITSTLGNALTTIRNSLSLTARSAPILPEEEGEPTMKSNPRNSTPILPVEINNDFVKHLDWEERAKVALLVRHLREGDSPQSQLKNDINSSKKEETSMSMFSRYTIVRSTKSTRSANDNNSNNNSIRSSYVSGKNFENNKYIIISADEGDENNNEDDHDLLFGNETPEQSISSNHKVINEVNPLTSHRRSLINTSVNRVENLKNDVIESFNRRIGQAMKQNR